jgi:hypothetical protein
MKTAWLVTLFLSIAHLSNAEDDVFQYSEQDLQGKLKVIAESRQRLATINSKDENCKKEISLFCADKNDGSIGNCLLDARRTGKNFTEKCGTYLHFKQLSPIPSNAKSIQGVN